MTIKNSTLKRIGLAILSLAVVSGLGFGAWKGREAYLANEARVASLEANLASEKASGASLATQLASKDAELTATNEKYGVAVSAKSAAETAKAKADADAADAKKKAASASNEAAWQKGQADQANGNLAACASNVSALNSLVYYVDQQRGYNLSAVGAMNSVTTDILAGNMATASVDMDGALWYLGKSDELQPTVDYWLGQIK